MTRTIEKHIRTGLGLAVGFLLAITGVAYWSATRSLDTNHLVRHTYKVLGDLERTQVGLLEVETSTRGFALSGDELFLASSQPGREAVDRGLADLRRLTRDNPAQQRRLDALEPLVARQLQWAARILNDRRTRGFESVSKELATREGEELRQQIRRAFAEMESAERQLLEARSDQAQAEARLTMQVVSAGCALAVALVGLAGALVHRDFQRRQQAEKERDRFFALSRDLFCIAGLDGYFKRLNPAWEQTLGFPPADFLAQAFIEFVHPEDREATLRQAGKLAAGEEIVAFENRYQHRDGSYRWLSWNSRSDLTERRIYASARDVTEQKQSVEQIARLNSDLQRRAAQLEALNQELEAFSYSVSHDLRAPLRHVIAYVNLLQDSPAVSLDKEGARHLELIGNSAQRMGQLIDDLLSFSRMGRADLQWTPLRLEQLVQEALSEVQAGLNGRGVDWQLGPLPEVQGDAAMLRLVLVNLLSNALKFTRTRNPARIEIGARASEQEHIVFVRDNGVGFNMRYLTKLFNVFERLHTQGQFEGTGIGLANVRRIILRHGGRVWAEGKENEGATFYFSLPKAPGAS